jgi:hypothetical protein
VPDIFLSYNREAQARAKHAVETDAQHFIEAWNATPLDAGT